MTDEVADHGPTTGNELAIVQIVLNQLTLMEARLSSRIDRIDAAEAKRWTTHETEHDDLLKAISAIGHRLDDHLKKEANDELVFDARVAPVRRLSAWVVREWRTIAIVGLLLADFASQIIDRARGLFQ